MRYTKLTLAILLALSLSGCVLGGKPLTKAGTPPAVKPQPAAAPSAPTAPVPRNTLSIPQTNVQLPDPQPLTPEALATTLPLDEPPAPPAAAPKPPARPRQAAGTPLPAPATQPATPPPQQEAERAPLQEVVPVNEQTRLHDETTASKQEARQRVKQVEGRQVTRKQQNTIDRIMSFLRQADDMERRGNLRQASELAGKALALARELQ